LGAQIQDSTSGEVDSGTLQRILQYESVLGNELSTKIGVCVDDNLGKAWFIDDDTSQEIPSSVLNTLRQASETCAITMTPQKGRLVSQLREMTERQLVLSKKLDQPVADSRKCVKTPGTIEAFKSCISKATGKPPTEIELRFWTVLIQRSTFQE
jgi:hypothetical protein